MTNNSDSNDIYVTIEDVRKAYAAFIRIKKQVRQIAEQIDRHPDDDEIRQAWWRADDEKWKAHKEANETAFHYWKRTGVDIFPDEVI